MTWLGLAVCLAIPPLVALGPALMGSRFVVVATAAALAATVVWSVALLVIPTPSEDTGPLPIILLPFFAIIHTFFAVALVGIPWAIVAGRHEAG